MSEKKIWVETIIDAFDLETTKEIAKKAVEYGSDWISVGTNNMYACGFMHSITVLSAPGSTTDAPVRRWSPTRIPELKSSAICAPYQWRKFPIMWQNCRTSGFTRFGSIRPTTS